jgi:hypothetical protein
MDQTVGVRQIDVDWVHADAYADRGDRHRGFRATTHVRYVR